MSKKSGIGKNNDDFKFEKKIKQIPDIREFSESSKISFYITRDKNNDIRPDEPCGFFHPGEKYDLSIIGKPGRKLGDIVIYDPIQKKNYLSQANRYEKSLDLLPGKIVESGNTSTYYFCANTSPTGFWEVVCANNGTYLRFTNPILTVICPRPFELKDLTDIETDGESIQWSQTQGRITSIVPASGNGSLSPTISIIGTRTPLDPPILLLAELEDNTSVFDFLVIRTTIADIISGVGGSDGKCLINSGSSYSVPCVFGIVPEIPNTASIWTGMKEITWGYPTDTLWLTEYRIEQNINGVFQSIRTTLPDEEHRAWILPGAQYRVTTVHSVCNSAYSTSSSCIFLFPNNLILASDHVTISSATGKELSSQYSLSVQILYPVEQLSGLSGSDGVSSVSQYPLEVKILPILSDSILALNGGDGRAIAINYNLAGSIIG